MTEKNLHLKALEGVDWGGKFFYLIAFILDSIFELAKAIVTWRFPWLWWQLVTWLAFFFVYGHVDQWLLAQIDGGFLYPRGVFWAVYSTVVLTIGFWGWAFLAVGLKQRRNRKLKEICENIGLKTKLGRTPRLVFEDRLDASTVRLRLKTMGLSIEEFKRAKPSLEASFRKYITNISEHRTGGTVDITLSTENFPEHIDYSLSATGGKTSFLIGQSRTKAITATLAEIPHLLIAGETSSGKSTYLRQFITSFYVKDRSCHFSLLDLKGGLEFQLFENLPRVKVFKNLGQSLNALKTVDAEMERRMSALAELGASDIKAYNQMATGSKSRLSRHIIVVDEGAELYLAAQKSGELSFAKAILSKVARQGRAVGLHLVFGTQRPDARALDTQIKGNLPGKLCFQMGDHSSSMTVLGSGRAKDLPGVPGRAIWQRGLTNFEVQTPYLSVAEADLMLAQFREETPPESTPEPQPMDFMPELDG